MPERLNGTTWSALLTHLHRGGAYGYWWTLDEEKTFTYRRGPRAGQHEKCKRTTWWPVGSPTPIPNGPTEHVYFGVHPVTAIPTERRGRDGPYTPKPEHTRPLVTEIAAVNCLFGEFDSKDFAEGKAGALAHIERLAVKPSALIDSGGGYHAYWLLGQPIIITDANREAVKALQARWVAWVESDDDSKDLARVLRVPGRPNIKAKYAPNYPIVAFVYADFDRLYTLDELALYIPPEIVVVESRTPTPFTPAPGDHSAYVQTAYDGEVQTVLSAPDGQKHHTLRNAAIKLAGLIWTGHLTEQQIADGLQDAAKRNGADIGYAHKTIADGIAYGVARPRAIADRPQSSASGSPALPSTGQSLSRSFVLKCVKEGEAGDAQLIEALYQGQMVYDHSAGAWYAFSEHVWNRYEGPPRRAVWGKVASVYLEVAAALQGDLEHEADDGKKITMLAQVDALTERARKLRNIGRINNVLTLAQELLGIKGNEWDANPWLLGVANGVLDLRTGTLRDGRADDYIRIQAPTAWRGLDAPCPRWERFVSEVLSDESDRVVFLQRLLGYALNGTSSEHVLGICVGERGRNGKRVLFETLQHVLGDYTKSVSTDVVIGQDRFRGAGRAQTHVRARQGRRVAFGAETGETPALSTAQVKNITGGDPITARWLHQNPITFMPTHTLFLQTNRKPQAPADDDALWERVKVIEFKVRFVDEPHAADERPRDPDLEAALRAEASGILAWLVRGGLDWLQGGLRTPSSVKLARDTYRKGESIEPFIETCCTEWEGGSAEGSALYEAYKTWCELSNLHPKSAVWLGKQLVKRYEKGRVTTAGPNAGRTVYHGVTLLSRDAWTIENAPDTSTTLQSPINPSIAIETPNNGNLNQEIEGLQAFSKSSIENPTHVGENMHNPSIPSIPSIEQDRGISDGRASAQCDGDTATNLRLRSTAPELYAAGWRGERDGAGYRLISPEGTRTGLFGDLGGAIRAAQPAPPTIDLTDDWQEVPEGVAIPPGGVIRMDFESGKNFARKDTS